MPLTNPQIDHIEASLGLKFPGLYRKLLVEVGPGRLTSRHEIFEPVEIVQRYCLYVDDRTLLFKPYFPIGCDLFKQEIWIIDADRELAASIAWESAPDVWPDEQWLTYEDWVTKIFDPALRENS